MRFSQTLTLAFSIFALFVGAGNVIFPPEVGIIAGGEFSPALLGFIATAVGLPILGLVIMSHAGSLDKLLSKTPRWASFAVIMFIYLIIGPLFATPRTSLVSFELGIVPLLDTQADYMLYLYVPIFFLAAGLFSIVATHLTDAIGQYITPALILLLLVFSYFIFTAPANPVNDQLTTHIDGNAFLYGFIQGYKTLDGIVSIIFGIIVITALKDHGVEEQSSRVQHTLKAGAIAGVCMAFLYTSLMYLGASNQSVLPIDAGGSSIIESFINRELGVMGQYVVSLIIFLACFSTVVGLLSACAQFFKNTFGLLGYSGWVWIMSITSALLALRGLDKVIEFAVPLLSVAYPAFMVLMILYCISSKLIKPIQANLVTFVSVLIYCLLAFAKSHHWLSLEILDWVPLSQQGFGWLSVFIATLICHQLSSGIFGKEAKDTQTANP